MKRYLILIGLVVVVAAGSHALTRGLLQRGEEDQMTWLSREFKLTAGQAAAVEKMQADYQPVCAGHCRLIMAARDRLAAAPGDAALLAEIARLEQKCHEATLAHLRNVAAQMDPGQGRRFLTLVEPKVSRHAHLGPLGLK
jgi:hypothetical protein